MTMPNEVPGTPKRIAAQAIRGSGMKAMGRVRPPSGVLAMKTSQAVAQSVSAQAMNSQR
jgi:hypothetical protein